MGDPRHPARSLQDGQVNMPALQAEALALEVIRLRRQLENGIAGPWAETLPGALDTRLLHHLPPPAVPSGAEPQSADPRLEPWRAAFRLGLCYYRHGPGFIQVKDVREPRAAARITIDQAPLIDAFLRCGEQPVHLASQAGDDQAALEVLLREGLLLQFGPFVTTAPYRMRCWPIPAGLA